MEGAAPVTGFYATIRGDVEAIRAAQNGNEWSFVMNTNKDALKNAPGYKYDRNTTKWVSDKS